MALHHALHPLQSLEPTGYLDRYFLRLDRLDRSDRDNVGRLHTYQSPPLGSGCKRGTASRRSAARDLLPTVHLPDGCWPTAYDANSLRSWLAERGVKAVIPFNPTRKHPHRYDKKAYKGRNLSERMFCRLKDFRRIVTRYDKRADIYLSAILLAAALTWWIN